ncbi:MAG: bifunctional 3,4-dihydroxy-2-butanone-4-phosphate synthase/GTP cyclohydrolase II [Phycisphaerae bacterium]|nr:bifunctional 3,4-dihydroxy-2-butanone-4-phosphate synthase/GTP cyclohydrolase II [Phycisphaerae bacterium]MCZ2401477.1 bifunctional 3,4-dihydroxy-2-butanone-4-phosphate synthase/GTP cyclohydrolase II [Phycisphaerae bacterium]
MPSHSDRSKTPFSPIQECIDELRRGNLIVLVDDEDRENEGDLVCAAEHITPEKVNFMLRYGRGTLCVALARARCERLQFHPQSAANTTRYGTAFTVTIDGGPHLGVTTGVSASDRAATIRQTVAEGAVPEDFVRPGHVNPLIAREGGVLVRAGQTEGSVDLCTLAGLMPGAALIEILNDDGSMARVPQLATFCASHGLKMCTIADLIEFRMRRERLVERIESVPLRNEYGEWLLIGYRSRADEFEHVALCLGGVGAADDAGQVRQVPEPTLVRVHSECLTGDVFGSDRCECGEQLHAAMAMIAREGRGVLVYLRQEGRGIGLLNKLRAYKLQDQGLDTVEANEALGLPADRRDYGVGAQILRDVGLTKVRILTNNPKKVSRLEVYGLEVVDQIPLEVPAGDANRRYLQAKKYKLGHTLRNV